MLHLISFWASFHVFSMNIPISSHILTLWIYEKNPTELYTLNRWIVGLWIHVISGPLHWEHPHGWEGVSFADCTFTSSSCFTHRHSALLLEAIAHFYTVTDDYTVLPKFQSIFFPQGQQQSFWALEHLKGGQSGWLWDCYSSLLWKMISCTREKDQNPFLSTNFHLRGSLRPVGLALLSLREPGATL